MKVIARLAPRDGANVNLLLGLAVSHGLRQVTRYEGRVILVGDHGAVVVDANHAAVKTIRVLRTGDEHWRTVIVYSAIDIIAIAESLVDYPLHVARVAIRTGK